MDSSTWHGVSDEFINTAHAGVTDNAEAFAEAQRGVVGESGEDDGAPPSVEEMLEALPEIVHEITTETLWPRSDFAAAQPSTSSVSAREHERSLPPLHHVSSSLSTAPICTLRRFFRPLTVGPLLQLSFSAYSHDFA